MTLAAAKIQKSYIITCVSGCGSVRRRLLDMGFTKGTKLFLEGAAYKRSTVLVLLRGAFIALRNDAAALIEISEGGGNGI